MNALDKSRNHLTEIPPNDRRRFGLYASCYALRLKSASNLSIEFTVAVPIKELLQTASKLGML